jgi:hypothetical protein
MKHKWISHLNLVPIPTLSHYNLQVFQNPKKSEIRDSAGVKHSKEVGTLQVRR